MKKIKILLVSLLLVVVMAFPSFAYYNPYYPHGTDYKNFVIWKQVTNSNPDHLYYVVMLGDFDSLYYADNVSDSRNPYRLRAIYTISSAHDESYYGHDTLDDALNFAVNGLQSNSMNGKSSQSWSCPDLNSVVYTTVPVYTDSTCTTLALSPNYGDDGTIDPQPQTDYLYNSKIPSPQNHSLSESLSQ